MSKNDYYIIFDTNTLYVNHKTYGDFTGFSFNSTFDNVVGILEELDIYEHITVLVPTVVYEEMKKQKISAHDDKKETLQKAIGKSKFPEFEYSFSEIDYEKYVSDKIIEYKKQLASGQTSIAELPLPTEKRFSSIVHRAFTKLPPFYGVEKESDKGFKDALLWESILELKENTPQAKIVFYSKDNGFCDVLIDEFQSLFNDQIFICKNEFEVKNQLIVWAKIIDEYTHIPEDISEEERESERLLKWFDSDEFFHQLLNFSKEFREFHENIFLSEFSVYSIESIDKTIESELIHNYDIVVNAHITFTVKDKERVIGNFTHDHVVTIGVKEIDKCILSIDYIDVYSDEDE
ncbi:MAG: PIN domain-containing protein [Clostridium sp.]|uniref:PIN domain-containing protein n=1 Tax=Clostridium sp. TaxID=1506 RepID=UPI002914D665|nr:PIN domain-containing protein [Clostridium sp.]MDU7336741.1 PIN domain-containing protein [Clostridium sp.]